MLILSASVRIRRESVDLGVVFMKRSVLALKFEQKGLKFADRTAFNSRANFGEELRRPRLAISQESAKQTGSCAALRLLAVYWLAMPPDCELTGRAAAAGMSRNFGRSAARSSAGDSVFGEKTKLVGVEALGKRLVQFLWRAENFLPTRVFDLEP